MLLLAVAMFAQLYIAVAVLVVGAWGHPGVRPSNVGIYGGHRISIEQAPYMASLRLKHHHLCGASIIHKQFVITAAHCVNNGTYEVVVGTDNIYDGSGHIFEVDQIIVHEEYVFPDFDVSVIKLKEALKFDPKVAKLNLATAAVPPKSVFNISGWGYTENDNNTSPYLLQTTVPIIPRNECALKINFTTLTKNMLCAGSMGHDTCRGDSGGPLVLGNELVGVTSFGEICGTPPGVYTKISTLIPWIRKTIEKLS